MITVENIPDEFRTDHLLLLIGANPLPNYVAARLLAKPKSTIHLLGTGATGNFAKAVAYLVQKYHATIKTLFWEIDTVNGAKIRQQVQTIIKQVERTATVGLHYTGGTKVMAIHTYRTVAEARTDTIFSYLDAQTLTMRIEYADASFTRDFPIKFACDVDLEELLGLHGYGLKTPLRTTAKQPQVTSALAAVYAQKESYNAYRNWYDRAFPKDFNGENAIAAVQELFENSQLAPFASALKAVQSPITLETFATVAEAKTFRSAATWFNGLWLEEYTLLQLDKAAHELKLKSYTIKLLAKKGGFKDKRIREFEIDLAALWGYQLYALSCRATDLPEQAKEHLLEVVVRASQLGGDEAKCALICCSDRPENLEVQVNETWFQDERANQVRVFGRKHLPDLALHLREWFEATKEA